MVTFSPDGVRQWDVVVAERVVYRPQQPVPAQVWPTGAFPLGR